MLIRRWADCLLPEYFFGIIRSLVSPIHYQWRKIIFSLSNKKKNFYMSVVFCYYFIWPSILCIEFIDPSTFSDPLCFFSQCWGINTINFLPSKSPQRTNNFPSRSQGPAVPRKSILEMATWVQMSSWEPVTSATKCSNNSHSGLGRRKLLLHDKVCIVRESGWMEKLVKHQTMFWYHTSL